MTKYRAINEALARAAKSPTAERLARTLDPLGDALENNRAVYDTLTGESFTGHPIHPAIVHMPIGLVAAAVSLEVVGLGRFRLAPTILTGLAVAAAVPSAITGTAEWTRGRPDRRQRRLGAVHAATASTGTTMALLSFGCRLIGARGAARIFLAGAAGAYGAAGFIGGDLVYGRDLVPEASADAAPSA